MTIFFFAFSIFLIALSSSLETFIDSCLFLSSLVSCAETALIPPNKNPTDKTAANTFVVLNILKFSLSRSLKFKLLFFFIAKIKEQSIFGFALFKQ